MGMYTEIHVAGSVKAGTKAAEVIEYLFGDRSEVSAPSDLPDHPFFECSRWDSIGASASYYLSPIALKGVLNSSAYDDIYFHSVSNIKNYDDEIEKFFAWLRSECIRHYGHSRYEETKGEVTTYYFDGKDTD
jgi:hypothetical protein